MNAPVWTYWEGPLWPHIEIGLATMRHFCGEAFRLVTPASLNQYIPEGLLHPRWRALEIGIGSDVIRAGLLATHGGFWIDADTIMLRDVQHLATDSDLSYMMWSRPPERVIAGYCYARKGSPVVRHWLEAINDKLARNQTGWCVLGEQSLTPALRSNPQKTVRMPLSTFLPIEIDREPKRFFASEDWRAFLKPETVAFGLNHSFMTYHYGPEMRKSAAEMARSDMLIHKLLTWGRQFTGAEA